MSSTPLTNEQVSYLGFELFDKKVKPQLGPECKGKWVAIKLDSGEYFLGASAKQAAQFARETYPDEIFFITKV